MKSFLGLAASSRSKSVAVTTVSAFWAKRRAVSFTMAKAVGITSLSAFSRASSISLSCLSISLKIGSRSSIGVSSIFARNSSIFSLKGFAASCTYFWISLLLARSSSLVSFSISGDASFTFSTSG